jgi:hypothetical protein
MQATMNTDFFPTGIKQVVYCRTNVSTMSRNVRKNNPSCFLMLNISLEAVNATEIHHQILLSEQPTYLTPISAIKYQPKYINFHVFMALVHQTSFWVSAPRSNIGAKTQRITIITLSSNSTVNNQDHTI